MMGMLANLVETKPLCVEVLLGQALCIQTLEQAILAQFPAQTQLLRWAIVGRQQRQSTTAVTYCVEATICFV